MEVNKKPWPIATVCGTKDRVDTNPDFQRPAVWSRPQKQLLDRYHPAGIRRAEVLLAEDGEQPNYL